MKREEALREAQRRFGFYGWVKNFTDNTYSVGKEFDTTGVGDSWEAAFVDADIKLITVSV